MKHTDRVLVKVKRQGIKGTILRGSDRERKMALMMAIMDSSLPDIKEDFNPYHDKQGRFASRGGSSGGGAQWHSSGKRMTVSGPKDTKRFVKSYLEKHPEVASEIPKYRHVRQMVMNFQKDNPGAEEGTYSATTGKKVDNIPGICVTFHQNNAANDPLGGYDDDDYAAMCAIARRELGCDDVYIGYFGNAEVSFSCRDEQKAMDFAIEHNQHSIYDPETDSVKKNPYYHPTKNRIEGH